MCPFYTCWKARENQCFYWFSGGIIYEHRPKKGWDLIQIFWFRCRFRFFPIIQIIMNLNLSFLREFSRSSHRRCSTLKGVVKNFAKFPGKHLCQSLFFYKVVDPRPQACKFIKKETLAQVHSSEFGKTFKSNIFTKRLRATASVFRKNEWSDFDQNLQKLGNFGSFRLHKLLFHKNTV